MKIDWVGRSKAVSLGVRNFIDGRVRVGQGVRTQQKVSPRDGQLLCHWAPATSDEVDESVTSARRAFSDGRWSKLPLQRRKEVMLKMACLIERHQEEIALLECLDVGKPISGVLNFDIPTAVALIRFNAEAIDKCHGKVYATDTSGLSFETRRPLGVVGAIVGWNFPLVLLAQKIGPALVAGNSVVLKPSELTSCSASRIAELALEAGVPEGVFNVVTGDVSVGATLTQHGNVDLLSFTGSTRTGKAVLRASAESNMKRLILECGGKAPNVVFEDCGSLEAVADAVVSSAFWNQGQVCVASSRLLVQESIREPLVQLLVARVSQMTLGDPLNEETQLGALISAGHQRKVQGYIESGQSEGARLLYQSAASAPVAGGFYVTPALFDRVASPQRIAQEEIFGPVLSILSFRDESEAIKIANDTIYGLSATVWTRDFGRAHRITNSLDAGWMVVNTTDKPMPGPSEIVFPIGGHKESGLGVEGGLEGLEAYMRKSSVQIFV